MRMKLAAGCILGLTLVVAASGAGATPKLSEGSREAAYSAGIGRTQSFAVPVVRRLTAASARCAGTTRKLGSPSMAYAALVKKTAIVRAAPSSRSHEVERENPVTANGFQQVLGVIGVHVNSRCAPDWYLVELPVLPNGKTGWVRAWTVRTYRVLSRIVVDVSQRRLQLFRSGALAFETRIAVGSPSTPTPLGRFFVNERYVLPDDGGPFGPNALGISAHSDVLQHVWVEDGPIGIHGTNEPWSIGRAASHGCIRVPNAVMRRLFPLAPAGTPVIVHA